MDNDKICEKLDKIIDLLESNIQEDNGEVIFKFKHNDKIIPIISNINEFMSSIYELMQYRRQIYKYDVPGEIYIDENTGKIYTTEELNKMSPFDSEPMKLHSYIDTNEIINKIDEITEDVDKMVNNYWY